ncbi:hypothetical protein BDR07DRAFT_1464781 [Suillus spraguei]|nr:hypothetical protein BDR07DRAFT_1464781 [Suillus spraguei]
MSHDISKLYPSEGKSHQRPPHNVVKKTTKNPKREEKHKRSPTAQTRHIACDNDHNSHGYQETAPEATLPIDPSTADDGWCMGEGELDGNEFAWDGDGNGNEMGTRNRNGFGNRIDGDEDGVETGMKMEMNVKEGLLLVVIITE